MKRRLKAPSPALVIALIALFIALGGSSYAAINALPKNSVGSKQLKKNAVTSAKIKNHAVTASKINTSGLTVPNATHATSADSATSATNATNATTAANATQLGGVAASHYLTKSGVLTIPGVAFQTEGSGSTLACIPETGSAAAGSVLYAPVELPNGVTVTQMTYYWWDNGASDSVATLHRIPLPASGGVNQTLASASSSGTAAVHTSSSTTSITTPTIDNSNWMYYVRASFPDGHECVDAVQIAYTG